MQTRPLQSVGVPVTEQAESVSGTAGCHRGPSTAQADAKHLDKQATHPSLGTVVSVRNSYVLLTGRMLSLPPSALSTSVVWY